VQHLKEQSPERLQYIFERLSERVPCLEKVEPEILADGRLLLTVKDAPFEQPIQARFASDGTLKMLAYLTVLYDPEPPPLVGIEEPENHLHPRLLPGLAGECRMASATSQLMITTHSPHFVSGVQPEELWVLFRNRQGYTEARRATETPGVNEFMAHGADLGALWMEGHLGVGDPLNNQGGATRPVVSTGSSGRR